MNKPKLDIVVAVAALLLWAGNAGASIGVPDGGATSLLFVGGLAALAAVRKLVR